MVDLSFTWGDFLKELFYHVFFPLSVPFIWCFEGGCYLRNHRFGLGSVLMHGLPITALVLNFVFPNPNVTLVEVASAIMCVPGFFQSVICCFKHV